MKIKTFNKTYSKIPNKCQHEWRIFGTRLCEEVWTPIRLAGQPKDPGGWVICDKCGWQPYVKEYKIIGEGPHMELGVLWPDYMVEIIDWGNEKEPTKPIVEEFAYAEYSLKDKLKRWFRNIIETLAIAFSFGL